MLLRRPGEVVTREELQHALWPAGTFVEFEHGLNTAVKKIRQALGDSADNPRFIETLPRKGYRFIAPVDGGEAKPPVRRWKPAWFFALLGVSAVAGLSAIFIIHAPKTAGMGFTAEPATTYPGREMHPSFSPDGTQVAFTWNGENQDNFDIYMKVLGAESPLRLTSHPADDMSPAWSPDGRFVAFLRFFPDGTAGVFLVPPTGGAERKVADALTPNSFLGPQLTWSPDGKQLVLVDKDSLGNPSALFRLSIESGEKRKLTNPPKEFWGDDFPAISTDGRTLAFCRLMRFSVGDLYLLSLSEDLAPRGEPKRRTFEGRWAASPAWAPGGREIVFSFGFRHFPKLCKISTSGSARPQALAALGGLAPAISRLGRLAYGLDLKDVNIWRVEVPAEGVETAPPVKTVSSTLLDHFPHFSPDGKKISFASNRSGSPEIWVADSDGRNAVQLTSFGDRESEHPSWSPDGRRIVFQSDVGGQSEILVVDAEGGAARRLTDHAAEDNAPSWSRDGRSIYFASNRSGQEQVWRMPAEGGEAVQVTRKEGRSPEESPDGKFLYYLKAGPGETNSLWRTPLAEAGAAGEEAQVLESIENNNYAVVNHGIYFIRPREGGSSSIQFLDFRTGKTSRISIIPQLVVWGFSVSPDSKRILYTVCDSPGADLMLVENFQ